MSDIHHTSIREIPRKASDLHVWSRNLSCAGTENSETRWWTGLKTQIPTEEQLKSAEITATRTISVLFNQTPKAHLHTPNEAAMTLGQSAGHSEPLHSQGSCAHAHPPGLRGPPQHSIQEGTGPGPEACTSEVKKVRVSLKLRGSESPGTKYKPGNILNVKIKIFMLNPKANLKA